MQIPQNTQKHEKRQNRKIMQGEGSGSRPPGQTKINPKIWRTKKRPWFYSHPSASSDALKPPLQSSAAATLTSINVEISNINVLRNDGDL
jgi:hypothetical protein